MSNASPREEILRQCQVPRIYLFVLSKNAHFRNLEEINRNDNDNDNVYRPKILSAIGLLVNPVLYNSNIFALKVKKIFDYLKFSNDM